VARLEASERERDEETTDGLETRGNEKPQEKDVKESITSLAETERKKAERLERWLRKGGTRPGFFKERGTDEGEGNH